MMLGDTIESVKKKKQQQTCFLRRILDTEVRTVGTFSVQADPVTQMCRCVETGTLSELT